MDCPHQAQERQRLLQEIRQKHNEIIDKLSIENLLTEDQLTGKLPEIPAEHRGAMARLQVDIWRMAKELWHQSRLEISKIDKIEEKRIKEIKKRKKELKKQEERKKRVEAKQKGRRRKNNQTKKA